MKTHTYLSRWTATVLLAVAGNSAVADDALQQSLTALPTPGKPALETWRAPSVKINPEVPVGDPGAAFPMDAGKRVRVRDVPLSPAPDRSLLRRFVIQGDDGDVTGESSQVRTFKTPPVNPASPEPVDAGRAVGDTVRSFTAITDDETIWIPPDHHLAVGPQYVVEVVNSGFAIYTKLGDEARSYRTFSNFLAANLPSDWSSGAFMFDPRITYDPLQDKYVMMVIGRDDANQKGYFWVAVSETSDPRDGWCIRRRNATHTVDGDPAWLDFAGLGTDAEGLYVTGNYIFFGGGVHGAAIHSYPVEMMTGCDAVTGWKFTNIQWPSGGDADSLQPAQAHTINSFGETFFVNTKKFSGDKVMLSRLSGDRGNGPTLTRAEIDIPAYNAIENNVDQPGSATDVDGGKSKAISAVYVNRRVFFALTTDVLNDASASGWLTVKLNTDSNTKEWHHLLWSGEGRYLFYPALTVQGTGNDNNIGIFGSWTDAETADSPTTQFPSGLFKLYENHPADSAGRFTIPTPGTSAYAVIDNNGRNRWGDYSGASYDWTCGHAWGVVQSSTGSTDWKTSVVAYEFDDEGPCAMIYVTTPALGEVWDSGTIRTIRWDSANLPASDEIIVIALGDGVLTQIGDPLPPGTTSLSWEVHEYPGDENRIIVGSWNGIAYTALHYGDEFTIADRSAPSPNPPVWQNEPRADSVSAISMRIQEVGDVSEPIEYYFADAGSPSGGSGANDSAWSTVRDYTDTGLEPNHEYCYHGRARDAEDNETANSLTRCVHTLARQPVPAAFTEVTGLSATVNWVPNGNSAFTEYQAQNVTSNVSSGWQSETYWAVDGLAAGATYQFRVRARNGDGIVTDWVAVGPLTTPANDPDGDGIPAFEDNCALEYNPGQFDGDGDGYGNRCDTDASQDCVTNAVDLGILKSRFFSNDPVVDFNVDGVVNVLDLGIIKARFFTAPGPSGLTSVCN